MSAKTARIAPCPNCGKPSKATLENPWRPFCSERCKLIDLGEWVNEERRIPGESSDENPDAPVPPDS